MAHPFAHLKDHMVQKSRVSSICRATGGRVAHSDEAEDKALIKSVVKKAALKMDGGKSKQRPDKVSRKRGGRVKGKTIVNVNVAPQAPAAPPAGLAPPPMPMPPPPGAMPIGGPGAMAAKPPMMPPPGAGPAGPGGPAMPMRKRGGRVKKVEGGVVASTLNGPKTRPSRMDFKRAVEHGIDTAGMAGALAPSASDLYSPKDLKTLSDQSARKKGGRVNSGTKVFAEGERLGTKVSHDKGKSDKPSDLHRGRVVTFKSGGMVKSFRAYGGRVEAPGPGKGMGPDTGGGMDSGEGRLAMAKRMKRGG